MRRRARPLSLAIVLLFVCPFVAHAELKLPPGFTAQVYVSGQGFEAGSSGEGRGIPSTSTLAFDRSGTLYLATNQGVRKTSDGGQTFSAALPNAAVIRCLRMRDHVLYGAGVSASAW